MQQRFQGILFTDIETVPIAQDFADLDERSQDVFIHRFQKEADERSKSFRTLWLEKAALYAEFCKIVSVGMGYFGLIDNSLKGASLYAPSNFEFRVKTVVDENEVVVLKSFFDVLLKDNFTKICGHNFFDFDGPMLCRRGKIIRLPLPKLLDVTNLKPWETPWIDTMKIWAFGEWNAKISLDRLCFALGVPTPKSEMTGAQVKDIFYGLPHEKHELPFEKIEYEKKEVRFKAIGTYQAGDIVATANVFLRLNDCDVIPEHKIVYV